MPVKLVLGVASLLLTASGLMRLTSGYLALFALALAAHHHLHNPILEPGLFAMLGLLALWAETSLHMAHTGPLAGYEPPHEGQLGAVFGLAAAAFFCVVGVPGAEALIPIATAAGCGIAVFRKRQDARRASMAVLALMIDPGDCRYIRGIIAMITLACLLRRVVF